MESTIAGFYTDGCLRADNVYAVQINIPNVERAMRALTEVEADHKADVRIKIGTEVREYTMKEFLERLGFDAD